MDIDVNAAALGDAARENTAAVHSHLQRGKDRPARIPAGRRTRSEDIAGAAVFLPFPAADYMRGVILPVDGGWLAQ